MAFCNAQTENSSPYNYYFSPEFLLGKTAPSNENFPDLRLHKGYYLQFGKHQNQNPDEWAYRLNYPTTGISLGVSDLGNQKKIGYQISLMPFAEFDIFTIKQNPVNLFVGMGAAYFTRKFDKNDNYINRAVSTDLTWSFRLFAYYPFLKTEQIDFRIGAGYFHQSNGHTRFPNNGFNSFLGSVSANFNFDKQEKNKNLTEEKLDFKPTSSYYLMVNAGLGFNSFSDNYNTLKNVYAFDASFGKKFNQTFKVGVGFYYRFYEHYYDYISTNQFLVRDGEEFSNLKNNPVWNASTLGFFISGEMILLNHFALEARVGINFRKPAYAIDWRYNQGWDNTPREIPENWILGEFNSKYKLKKLISSKLGLKYYLISMKENPVNNFYIAASIHTNLGQADFTEFSLGYVYNFQF
jgi:hypothetical protein